MWPSDVVVARKFHLVDSFIGFGQISVPLAGDASQTTLEFYSLQTVAPLVKLLFAQVLLASLIPYSNC